MPKKKKRVGLPRVTLLAYDRRALVAFVSAVEALRLLVDDLRVVAADLTSAAAATTRRAARKPARVVAADPPAVAAPPTGSLFVENEPSQ